MKTVIQVKGIVTGQENAGKFNFLVICLSHIYFLSIETRITMFVHTNLRNHLTNFYNIL